MSEIVDSAPHSPDPTPSRRRFIRNLAVGALGAGAVLAGARPASAADAETGEVTLDAIMLTYFSAPLATGATTFYEIGRAFTSTVKLELAGDTAPRLKAAVPTKFEKVFAGTRFNQTESPRVRSALTLEQRLGRGAHEQIGAIGGTTDDTTFIGLLRPRFRFTGTPESLRFRVVGATAEFIYSVEHLRREAETPDILRSGTAASFLEQYVTDPSALVGPRYEPRGRLQPPFTISELAGREPAERVTATVKGTIVAQTGFESAALVDAFAVGNTIDVVYSSVQEDHSGTLMTAKAEEGFGDPANQVHWDSVFKTFVFASPNGV
jgi:hypothetical protein